MSIENRVNEAKEILKILGLPDAQVNDRSALTLLALLGLGPNEDWRKSKNPMIGITPVMSFMKDQYDKDYKPNTREIVRRQTMHQFVEAAIALLNPDSSTRATNSPKTVYQVTPETLDLLRTYGSARWAKSLHSYLKKHGSLKATYAKTRKLNFLPVTLANGDQIQLTQGGQNVLVKEIIEKFAPRFTPEGKVLYAGDTGDKDAFYDKEELAKLGVTIEDHGKMPDVIIHYTKEDWLVLIEAVTSHGPIDAKRHGELAKLLEGCKIGLVYVTTFLDRKVMREFLPHIAWETEVWVADAPDHLIHFNGERFLGPYLTPR